MALKSRFTAFRKARPSPAPPDPVEADATPSDGRPRLIVGLGNPGSEYGNTRHNVGVWTINLLAKRHRVTLQRHGKIDRATATIDDLEVTIARPRAYMNESGPPIAAEARRLRLGRPQLLVVYDELDLPTGRVRLRLGGGYGGNRGMRSVIGALGGNDVPRVRIGIDRPYDDGVPVRDPDRIADWVLSRPARAERTQLDAAVERAADAVELAAVEGVEAAMRHFNAGAGADAD